MPLQYTVLKLELVLVSWLSWRFAATVIRD